VSSYFLGIAVAIFQDDIRTGIQQDKTSLSAQVLKKSTSLFTNKQEEPGYDKVDYVYTIIGLIALVFGVVSYLHKENFRISSAAAALGIISIAWHYVLIAVVIAIVLIIIGSGFS